MFMFMYNIVIIHLYIYNPFQEVLSIKGKLNGKLYNKHLKVPSIYCIHNADKYRYFQIVEF